MPAPHILIVHASTHGRTATFATCVAHRLSTDGETASLEGARTPSRDLSLMHVNGVIVASAVTYGRHQRSVHRHVRRTADATGAWHRSVAR
jgi:menaquinone-dependent protoporphyrinogen IX oxidase